VLCDFRFATETLSEFGFLPKYSDSFCRVVCYFLLFRQVLLRVVVVFSGFRYWGSQVGAKFHFENVSGVVFNVMYFSTFSSSRAPIACFPLFFGPIDSLQLLSTKAYFVWFDVFFALSPLRGNSLHGFSQSPLLQSIKWRV